MKPYEGIFIFPPESTPDVRKSQLKNLDDIIARFGGEIQQKTEWGKRPVGYLLRKFQEGYFLLVDFTMDSLKATDFRKALQLTDDLLKFMVTCRDPKADKQAAMRAAQAAARPALPVVPAVS